MVHTNFVKLTMLFWEYVFCSLVQFSGFLLDFALQEFVSNIRFYLFLLYQELSQLQV